MSRPEFSRPVEVSRIGGGGLRESIEAAPEEREALARRMKLPAVNALSADLEILPWKKTGLRVKGRLRASVEQECVRTLDVFPVEIEAPVARLYAPPAMIARRREGEEAEIDPLAADEPDPLEGPTIDIGELVAETLALSLDPWPKKPGTDFVDYQTDGDPGAAEEPRGPSPFAGLEALKKKT